MGATKGWRGGDPNRSPYGPVREVGPSPRSSRRCRADSAESRQAAEAGQAGTPFQAAGRGHDSSRSGLVSATNFALLEGGISRRAFDAGFSRNDLHLSLRSGPRPAPQGADQASTSTSPDPATQTATANEPGQDQRHAPHQRAPS